MSKKVVVPAECHSDDHVWECKFDAASWLGQASNKEVIDLAKIGWGYNYEADAIAEFMEEQDAEIGFMFDYIRKLGQGFECSVDPEAALKWIRKYKPNLFETLDCLNLTETDKV